MGLGKDLNACCFDRSVHDAYYPDRGFDRGSNYFSSLLFCCVFGFFSSDEHFPVFCESCIGFSKFKNKCGKHKAYEIAHTCKNP